MLDCFPQHRVTSLVGWAYSAGRTWHTGGAHVHRGVAAEVRGHHVPPGELRQGGGEARQPDRPAERRRGGAG
eukprot:502160-Prorocentrum_minimum.AAC.2